MESKNSLETENAALEMYKKDLVKLRAAVLKKREKEIIKLESKIKNIEELSEYELQELYGFDAISKKVYERRLNNLKEYEKNKETFKYKPTALSLYLKMVNEDITNARLNIDSNIEDSLC